MDQELLTQAALAKRWKVSPARWSAGATSGTGPQYLKVGGRIVYRLTDIEAYEAGAAPRDHDDGPQPAAPLRLVRA